MASQNDQYTNQARQVLQNSQELVRRHRHNQLDVEHILLALLELDDGVPSRILTELGAPSNDIRGSLHKALVLQRQFKVGCPGMVEGRLYAWRGSGWPARCAVASLPAN